MRTNVLRCVLVYLMVVGFSGCYSGGKWSMPGITKSSPFQTSPDAATPGPVGSPTRLAGIAATAAPTSQGNNSLSPPVVSYPSTAPAYASAGGVATVPQYPYPSTSAPPAQGYSPAYTASTAGVPGVGAYGTPSGAPVGNQAAPAGAYRGASVPTGPYGTMPTYNGGPTNMPTYSTQPGVPSAAAPYPTGAASSSPTSGITPYSQPATAIYPSTGAAPTGYTANPASPAPQSGYPVTTAGGLTNPVRSVSPYSSSQAGGAAPGANSGALDRYSAAAAGRGMSTPSGILADRGASAAGDSLPASYDRGSALSSSSNTSALTGNRYAAPGAASSGIVSNPYALPASAGSPAPAGNSAAGAGAGAVGDYRPGGVGDYVPSDAAAQTPATVPSSASTVGAAAPGYGQSTGVQ